jgi:2-succinyl-6-hydroxy-2,4-cyclohexadiene-1-carboxylate synthase
VRTLLLLHGFTGTPDSWSEVESRLAGARILAPALLGHDGTIGPPETRRFEDEVDRLAATVAAAGSGPIHAVGYSLGGRLALGLLARHPELLSGATLIGAHPGLERPEQRADRRQTDERWAGVLETEGIEAFVSAWEDQPLFATQRGVAPALLEAQRRRRLGHNPRGLARSLRVLGLGAMPSLRDRLGGIGHPVRLLAGERDAKFSTLAREMARALPRGDETIVPGAGHNLLLERPAVLAETLLEGMAA